MEEQFWQLRWQQNNIAFHEAKPHPFLESHFGTIGVTSGDTILVPLCGKSLDMDWLLAQGFHVIGIEFNQEAVEEVFERLALAPEKSETQGLKRYHNGRLTLYVGDFFTLDKAMLGQIDGIFDRGAVVALPDEMRTRYAAHLASITDHAPQLVIGYDYDQQQTQGPPFSVPLSALQQLYSDIYSAVHLAARPIEGPLAARCSGEEYAAALSPK
ncbi:MAG: thiopurine S-methyltransferase [Pseudomonadota bacterium]